MPWTGRFRSIDLSRDSGESRLVLAVVWQTRQRAGPGPRSSFWSEANNKRDVQQSLGHLHREIRFANHCDSSSGSHDRQHRRVHHGRRCRQRQNVHRQLATRLYAIKGTGARLGGCAPGILEVGSGLGTNPFAVFGRSLLPSARLYSSSRIAIIVRLFRVFPKI